MMNQNPDADDMPCFKIVHSDGRLGGFGLGIEDKIRRLRRDSIDVKDGRIVDFDRVCFHDFTTTYPLRALRQEQIQVSHHIKLNDDWRKLETVGGIDVAYPENEFDEAYGACVVLDYQTRQVIEEKNVHARTNFPFISTYFYYREFPLVQRLFARLKEKPSLLLLNGNGILHPYRSGFASHAGLTLGIPTIGVAKTLLYGTVRGSRVFIEKEQRGYAYSLKTGMKPVFVSPGHRVSLLTSLRVVKHLSVYKNPEPLRLAHLRANEQLLKRR
jgi:deoxyribonuclease V